MGLDTSNARGGFGHFSLLVIVFAISVRVVVFVVSIVTAVKISECGIGYEQC